MKFPFKKTLLTGLLATGILISSLVATVPVSATGNATLSISPSTTSVANGGSFTVTIQGSVPTDDPAAGVDIKVQFDKTKLQVASSAWSAADFFAGPDRILQMELTMPLIRLSPPIPWLTAPVLCPLPKPMVAEHR